MCDDIPLSKDDENPHMLDIKCGPENLKLLKLGSRVISLQMERNIEVLDLATGDPMGDKDYWAKVERMLENAKIDLLQIDQGYEILYDRTVKMKGYRIYFFKLDITPANQQKHSEIFCGIKYWVGDKLQLVS